MSHHGLPAFFVLGMILVGGIISLALTAFWIWMLVHAIQNKGVSEGEKVGWILAVVFLPFLGSLLYFFIGRPKAKQSSLGG